MAWEYARSVERINRFKETVPQVTVEGFADQYLQRFRTMSEERARSGVAAPSQPLFGLSNREAVIVNGVHVYATLLDFNQLLTEDLGETEHSHSKALRFLHFHYAACDRAIQDANAQRVDFHGPRLHAVIVEPAGPEGEPARVQAALELAERIRSLAAEASEEFGGGLASRYRIGIDSGVCVAINSGRGNEPEPLFLGNAANYAAKLADGTEEGVFVSPNVRAIVASLNWPNALSSSISRRGIQAFDASVLSRTIGQLSVEQSRSRILENWRSDLSSGRAKSSATVQFSFHYHRPPLASIDYAELSPSHSIRMPLISVFADIDGYTSYIDSALSSPAKVAEAVRNLHVIRGEMAAVVRSDFEGRKVRFIGDCIHALLATGEDTVDLSASVTKAVHMAGGLRSSFDISKQLLTGIDELGLAIGLDLGTTPISRIGIRGDRSVRVAISKATIASEDRQSSSGGRTTAIGEAAFSAGTAPLRSYFRSREVENMSYDAALANVPAVSVPTSIADDEARAHVAV